jgi:hypothetical protein
MQFMLLVYLDKNSLTKEQREQRHADSAGYARHLDEVGKYIVVAPLQPTPAAMSVRHRDERSGNANGRISGCGSECSPDPLSGRVA